MSLADEYLRLRQTRGGSASESVSDQQGAVTERPETPAPSRDDPASQFYFDGRTRRREERRRMPPMVRVGRSAATDELTASRAEERRLRAELRDLRQREEITPDEEQRRLDALQESHGMRLPEQSFQARQQEYVRERAAERGYGGDAPWPVQWWQRATSLFTEQDPLIGDVTEPMIHRRRVGRSNARLAREGIGRTLSGIGEWWNHASLDNPQLRNYYAPSERVAALESQYAPDEAPIVIRAPAPRLGTRAQASGEDALSAANAVGGVIQRGYNDFWARHRGQGPVEAVGQEAFGLITSPWAEGERAAQERDAANYSGQYDEAANAANQVTGNQLLGLTTVGPEVGPVVQGTRRAAGAVREGLRGLREGIGEIGIRRAPPRLPQETFDPVQSSPSRPRRVGEPIDTTYEEAPQGAPEMRARQMPEPPRVRIDNDGRISMTYQGAYTSGGGDASEALHTMRSTLSELQRDIAANAREHYYWTPGPPDMADPRLAEFYRAAMRRYTPEGYIFSETPDGVMHLTRAPITLSREAQAAAGARSEQEFMRRYNRDDGIFSNADEPPPPEQTRRIGQPRGQSDAGGPRPENTATTIGGESTASGTVMEPSPLDEMLRARDIDPMRIDYAIRRELEYNLRLRGSRAEQEAWLDRWLMNSWDKHGGGEMPTYSLKPEPGQRALPDPEFFAANDIAKAARELGYDSVTFRNIRDNNRAGGPRSTVYATWNRGRSVPDGGGSPPEGIFTQGRPQGDAITPPPHGDLANYPRVRIGPRDQERDYGIISSDASLSQQDRSLITNALLNERARPSLKAGVSIDIIDLSGGRSAFVVYDARPVGSSLRVYGDAYIVPRDQFGRANAALDRVAREARGQRPPNGDPPRGGGPRGGTDITSFESSYPARPRRIGQPREPDGIFGAGQASREGRNAQGPRGRTMAAIRDPQTGRVYVGANHAEAIDTAPASVQARLERAYMQDGADVGFVQDGAFVSREQAMTNLGHRVGNAQSSVRNVSAEAEQSLPATETRANQTRPRTVSIGRKYGYQPRDLIQGVIDGERNAEIAIRLGLDPENLKNVGNIVAVQLAKLRREVEVASSMEGGLTALARRWNMDESELRQFASGGRVQGAPSQAEERLSAVADIIESGARSYEAVAQRLRARGFDNATVNSITVALSHVRSGRGARISEELRQRLLNLPRFPRGVRSNDVGVAATVAGGLGAALAADNADAQEMPPEGAERIEMSGLTPLYMIPAQPGEAAPSIDGMQLRALGPDRPDLAVAYDDQGEHFILRRDGGQFVLAGYPWRPQGPTAPLRQHNEEQRRGVLPVLVAAPSIAGLVGGRFGRRIGARRGQPLLGQGVYGAGFGAVTGVAASLATPEDDTAEWAIGGAGGGVLGAYAPTAVAESGRAARNALGEIRLPRPRRVRGEPLPYVGSDASSSAAGGPAAPRRVGAPEPRERFGGASLDEATLGRQIEARLRQSESPTMQRARARGRTMAAEDRMQIPDGERGSWSNTLRTLGRERLQMLARAAGLSDQGTVAQLAQRVSEASRTDTSLLARIRSSYPWLGAAGALVLSGEDRQERQQSPQMASQARRLGQGALPSSPSR